MHFEWRMTAGFVAIIDHGISVHLLPIQPEGSQSMHCLQLINIPNLNHMTLHYEQNLKLSFLCFILLLKTVNVRLPLFMLL